MFVIVGFVSFSKIDCMDKFTGSKIRIAVSCMINAAEPRQKKGGVLSPLGRI